MMQPNNPASPNNAPAEPAEGTAQDGSGAPPQGGAPSGGPMSSMMLLVPFLLLIGLMFFMNRSERKKRATLESKLKKGDRVITRSGIVGKLVELNDRMCRVEIATGVNVQMLKAAIEGPDIDPATIPQPAAKDAPKADAAKLEKSKDEKSKDEKSKDEEKLEPKALAAAEKAKK